VQPQQRDHQVRPQCAGHSQRGARPSPRP
jgi:hypothetical protein